MVHKWFEAFNAHQLLSTKTSEKSVQIYFDIAEFVSRDTFEK